VRRGKAQFTLTKHHIVSTKPGNSGAHVGSQIKKPKGALGKKILCYITQYYVSTLTYIGFSCEEWKRKRL